MREHRRDIASASLAASSRPGSVESDLHKKARKVSTHARAGKGVPFLKGTPSTPLRTRSSRHASFSPRRRT
jgi:hypothetical protein